MAKTPEETLASARAWKANNREKVKAMRAAYYAANKAREHEAHRAWIAANPDKVAGYRKADLESRKNDEYREKARIKRQPRLEGIREYNRGKYRDDLKTKLKIRLTTLLNQALRRYKATKAAPLMELVGCSVEELIAHLESMFKAGMSWDVASRIHIDHRMPISSFDWSDPEQQRACFHFSNLQPLWDHENRKKHSTIPSD